MLSTSGLFGSCAICLLSSRAAYSRRSSSSCAASWACLIAACSIWRSLARVSISLMTIAICTCLMMSVPGSISTSFIPRRSRLARSARSSEFPLLTIYVSRSTFFFRSAFSLRSLIFSAFSFASSLLLSSSSRFSLAISASAHPRSSIFPPPPS